MRLESKDSRVRSRIWAGEHGVQSRGCCHSWGLRRFIFKVGCQLAAACQPFGMDSGFNVHLGGLRVSQLRPISRIARSLCRALSRHRKRRRLGSCTTSRPRPTRLQLQRTSRSIAGAASIKITRCSRAYARRSTCARSRPRRCRRRFRSRTLRLAYTYARAAASSRRCESPRTALLSKPARRSSSRPPAASARRRTACAARPGRVLRMSLGKRLVCVSYIRWRGS
jgi:hypothetical protein